MLVVYPKFTPSSTWLAAMEEKSTTILARKWSTLSKMEKWMKSLCERVQWELRAALAPLDFTTTRTMIPKMIFGYVFWAARKPNTCMNTDVIEICRKSVSKIKMIGEFRYIYNFKKPFTMVENHSKSRIWKSSSISVLELYFVKIFEFSYSNYVAQGNNIKSKNLNFRAKKSDWNIFVCFQILCKHGVWKSQKKYHSSLQAKRATFTFWVDKS